jgi:hypothetical protein
MSAHTVDSLISRAIEQRKDAERRLAGTQRALKSLASVAEAQGRRSLTAEEDRRCEQLEAEMRTAKADISRIDGEIAAYRSVADEETEIDRQQRTIHPTSVRTTGRTASLRIGAEERTYRPDQDPNGKSFLTDVVRQHMFGDIGANERLARHMQEERVERPQYLERAVGTSAFAGLTVPQYLTELYAPATAALRPFADAACNIHPLPEAGMSIEISKITTASSAALQATQNTAVSETNMDDTQLSVPVKTAAGQQTLSRQAIERGTGIDDVTMQDLFDRVATNIDSTLITEASTGLSAVASAVTYTDTTPTAGELWPKLAGAMSTVESLLLNRGYATHATMHPRRWNWLTSRAESVWPFTSVSGMPAQTGGLQLTNEYGPAVRARLSNGLLVVVDANIATNLGGGTNEDEIYVTPQRECHLWEDPAAPLFIRAEQPLAAQLSVLLVAYSYFAYTFSRYASGAMAKVSGSGLATPAF